MRTNEPGLELQEWETRWAEIEEALADDPTTELPLAVDEIGRLLALRKRDDDVLPSQYPEVDAAYEAARELAERAEAGLDVDPGDLAGAIEDLRLIRNALLQAGSAEPA